MSAPSSAQRSCSLTRLAKAYTWQPDGRVERTLRTGQFTFSGDARDLIRHAAQWVAPLIPLGAELTFFPRRRKLRLFFGKDDHGIQTHVTVTLHPSDVGLLLTYFMRDRSMMGMLLVDLPDDGTSEDLSVPRVRVDELARMPVPAMECSSATHRAAEGGR